VGIATGAVSKLLAVDVDPRNGGHESLEFLETKFGPLPDTVESQTGGGGRHLLFGLTGDEVFPSSKPWSGIEVKCDGAYIAAPFTTHPSGLIYHWREGHEPGLPLAPVPEWVVTALKERKEHAIATFTAATAEDGDRVIPEGLRDNALTSLAGTMQRRGMSSESILQAMLAENAARCRPPLPDADVLRIVRSVGRYVPDPEADPGVSKAAVDGYAIQFLDVVGLEQPKPIPWLLDGRIAFGDCSLIVGPPASGKSWLTYEIAVAGAMGLPVLGRFAHEGGLRVLLVDEENPRDEVVRRLWLLTQAWQVNPKELSQQLMVTKPCQGWSFRGRSGVYALQQQIIAFKPDVVIFDSFIAVATVVDEGDSVQVRRFFHDMVYPLRDICNSTMIFVHHTNKGAYLYERLSAPAGLVRGSIDFVAAVDSALLIESRTKKGTDKQVFRMDSIKVRRGQAPAPEHFELVKGIQGGLRPMLRDIEAEDPASKAEEVRDFILMLLQDRLPCPSERLRKWVSAAVGDVDDTYVRKILSRMMASGLVVAGRPENGDSRLTTYRLADRSVPHETVLEGTPSES
jgi:KaiC/GvpD/RAD55 family RecA-like ATPase